MNLYETALKSLNLTPEDGLPDVAEADFVQYIVRGSLTTPDGTSHNIRYVSFHPDHTDGPCAKFMLDTGEVVWTRNIKLEFV